MPCEQFTAHYLLIEVPVLDDFHYMDEEEGLIGVIVAGLLNEQ